MYDRLFHQVTQKGGYSEMNYINIFQISQAFPVSVGNNYSEDQLMHILLDNFHQGRKYSAQIAIHQAELRGEENIIDQKPLSITSLHTDHLNIDIISGSVRNNERENIVRKNALFAEVLTILQKNILK